MNAKLITENQQFTINHNQTELLLTWQKSTDLDINSMKKGITEFAIQCNNLQPTAAIIDASHLDQNCPALAWVSGQQEFDEQEQYFTWWTREIVPIYNDSGISCLAIATGNPNAPGELQKVHPTVKFKMAYLNDLNDAATWTHKL